MRGTILLVTFILLLPAFGVLGHDLYMAYGDSDEKVEQLKELDVDPNVFALSDVGRLWIAYAPDSLNMLRENISLATWENIVAPLMEQTALLVALVPLMIFYLFTAIFWVLGIGPFTGTRMVKKAGKKDFSVYERHNKKSKTKYGRK